MESLKGAFFDLYHFFSCKIASSPCPDSFAFSAVENLNLVAFTRMENDSGFLLLVRKYRICHSLRLNVFLHSVNSGKSRIYEYFEKIIDSL